METRPATKAQNGIPGTKYDRGSNGAKCPKCGTLRGQVTNTLPAENGIRVRYHCCRRCGVRFKSIEEH